MYTGIKQSLADQTGNFSFQFGITVSNLALQTNVGFTGISGLNLNWSLLQGKIYDNKSYYCGSYQSNQNVFISGNIGANSYDYYINGEVAALGQKKNTGTINSFYVNSQSGNQISFTNTIVGTAPAFTLNPNINFYTGQLASGLLVNNSNGNFRIFSGSSSINNVSFGGNTTGNITPGATGYFYNSIPNVLVGSVNSGSYTLYTNFGNITTNLFFTAIPNPTSGQTIFNYSPPGNISGAPLVTGSDMIGISFNTISGFNFINTPLNVTLFNNNTGTDISITGNVFSSGYAIISASGNFYYSTTFSGLGTGNISGLGGLNNNQLYSGIGSTEISQTVFYTGVVTGTYNSLYSTGLGSGYLSGFNSIVSGSGFGFYTGANFITGGSGLFLNLTGFNLPGSGYYLNNPTGTGAPFTEFLTGTLNSGVFKYSGVLYPTGINSGNFGVLSYGSGTTGGGLLQPASGIIRTGFTYNLQLSDSGVFTITNTYTGTGILCSGTGSFSITPTGNFTGLFNNTFLGSGIIRTGINTIGTGFLYHVPYIFPCYSYINGNYTELITPEDQGILNLEAGYNITGSGNTGELFSVYGNSGPDMVSFGPFSGVVFDFLFGSGYNVQNISGIITGNSTGLLYTRSFTGSWNLLTGNNLSGLFDFQQNNYFNNSGYYNPSGAINSSGNSIFIRVNYIPYPDYLVDTAILTITGLNSGIQITITGQRI